jgi:ferredoxin
VFRSAMGEGGTALVVNCPYCFAQFFSAERRIRDIYFEGLDLPVFYVTELVGLAMGLDPGALGLPLHYAASAGREREWVAGLEGAPAPNAVFDAEVTRAQLETCRRCLACVDDCQTATAVETYRPAELLELVLQGRTEEALARPDLWYCINCHECVQRCPQGFGMVRLLVRLKNMAIARGIRPEAIQHRFEELARSGFSFAPDEEARRECGLGGIHGPEPSDIERLIRQVTKGGQQ